MPERPNRTHAPQLCHGPWQYLQSREKMQPSQASIEVSMIQAISLGPGFSSLSSTTI